MEVFKDSEFFRRVLNRAHGRFVSDLDPVGVLDAFIEEEFLATSQIRDIQELQTTSMRNRIILSKVSQLGVKGYITFKKCLEKSGQLHLVHHLEQIENSLSMEITKDLQRTNKPIFTKHTQDQSHIYLDRKPTDKELASIAQAIGHGWELLAASLGLSRPTVERIKVDHRFSTVEQVYYMLMTWKQRKADRATVRSLLKELKDNTSVTVDWEHISNKLGIGDELIQETEGAPMVEEMDVETAPTMHAYGSAGSVGARAVPYSGPELAHGHQQGIAINDQPRTPVAYAPVGGTHVPESSSLSLPDPGLGFHPRGEITDGPLTGQPRQIANQPEPRNEVSGNRGGHGDSLASINREDFSVVEKCLFEGRLIDLTENQIKELKTYCSKPPYDRGIQGKIYISDRAVPGFKMRVVVKELTIDSSEYQIKKMRSITNEKLASRILHYGIVPLLALGEASVAQFTLPPGREGRYPQYHFVLPYLEKGDLISAIQADNTHMKNAQTEILDDKSRLRIMWQIASAIDYLHTGVKDVRGPVLHMDIKSANIVLDGQYNARLIDFGLARELREGDDSLLITASEVAGTEGYFPTVRFNQLTKSHDYHNFGIVIRELLTGLLPLETIHDRILRHQTERVLKNNIKTQIWLKGDGEKLLALSSKCIDCIKAGQQCLNSQQIKEDIRKIMISKPMRPFWKRDSNDKCEICMVNHKAELEMRHDQRCECQIQVCVACMRNSYLNPIMCHSCNMKIVPPIGEGWGAILIAGNDVKESVAKAFKKDVQDLKELFTSRSLPVTCIKEDWVEVVAPDKPGVSEELRSKIEDAFKSLEDKAPNTVIVAFSGHHGDKGFQLGKLVEEDGNKNKKKTDEFMTRDELCNLMKTLNKSVGKFIVFLDCCSAKPVDFSCKLEAEGLNIIQLNACSFDETASVVPNEFSLFTHFLVQALTKQAKGDDMQCYNKQNCKLKPCNIRGEFVKVNELLDYIHQHIKDYNAQENNKNFQTVKCYIKNAGTADFVIGYKYDFEVKINFKICDVNGNKIGAVDVRPHKHYADMEGLHKLLYDEYLACAQHEGVTSLGLAEYVNIICIEIDKGPKREHREELDTLEKVMAAWNNKRVLKVAPRHPNDIGSEKRVGIFVRDAQFIHACLNQWTGAGIGITMRDGNLEGRAYCLIFSIPAKKSEDVMKLLEEIENRLKERDSDMEDDDAMEGTTEVPDSPKADALKAFIDAFDHISNTLRLQGVKESKRINAVFPQNLCYQFEKFICFEIEDSLERDVERMELGIMERN